MICLPDTRPPEGPSTIDLSRARRLGIVGDVHAEDAALGRAIEYLEGAGAEALLCAGDIVDGDGDAGRCCRLLQEHDVWTVRGNHERWFLSNAMRDLPDATLADSLDDASKRYIEELPLTRLFETSAGSLLLCHGLGEDDMGSVGLEDEGYALESNVSLRALLLHRHQLVVSGHTHEAGVRKLDKTWLLNAGALKRAHDPCCLLLDLAEREVQLVSLSCDAPEVVSTHRL